MRRKGENPDAKHKPGRYIKEVELSPYILKHNLLYSTLNAHTAIRNILSA
jgi:hypothetical protein